MNTKSLCFTTIEEKLTTKYGQDMEKETGSHIHHLPLNFYKRERKLCT
jgi:hypothetical protein